MILSETPAPVQPSNRPPTFVERARRFQPRRRWLLCLILLAGLWGVRGTLVNALHDPHQTISVDHDTRDILVPEVQRKPTFRSTGAWWHGSWCPDAQYFRPATITGFWLEYQLFGPNGYAGFTLVHLSSHLLMLCIAFALLSALVGGKIAATAVVLFAVHANQLLGQATAEEALKVWKDSCDIWCTCVYLTSLWLYLKYLRSDKKSWLAASILTFLVALTFKEIAYMVAPFTLLLLWYEKKSRTHYLSALPFFALGGLMFCYRWWVLGGWGARTGQNHSWLIRWLNDAAGLRGGMVANDYLPLSVVCFVVALGLLVSRRYAWALIAVLMGGLCIYLTSIYMSATLEDTLLRYAIPDLYKRVVPAGMSVYLYWQFLRYRERGQIFAYLMIAITFVPLAVQPITSAHALYLVALGWSLFLTYTLKQTLYLLPELMPTRKLSVAPKPTLISDAQESPAS